MQAMVHQNLLVKILIRNLEKFCRHLLQFNKSPDRILSEEQMPVEFLKNSERILWTDGFGY